MTIEAKPARRRLIKGRAMCLIVGALVLTAMTLFGVTVMNRNGNHNEISSRADSLPVRSEVKTITRGPCTPLTAPSNNAEGIVDGNKVVNYKGVSFAYPTSLAHEIKSEIKPASPLRGETDKPEQVVPEYISFTFSGPYASQHSSSYFEPEISIYPIPKYRDALALSKDYVQSLNQDIESLKVILGQR